MNDRPPNDPRATVTAAHFSANSPPPQERPVFRRGSAIDPRPAWATTSRAAAAPDPEHWLDGLKGQHKQIVDA